ncbi:GNAT family N-acetyltransferase [Halococcoides cellulosivorans]|uniref:GNAT family N-acetyltransferase n=1 Tax=Halococcoides cellulosivorans TaxID=1679096 RepID=A0A2R4X2L2_9EURY|nr:GNAT family N-acetyltransferase [Halococcoides cellulosivorans]AWB28037.1 GNAT family N-acetyltransferase [Halococcoides cellulosivorans]
MTDRDGSFPETPAGPFERPPRSFVDGDGQTIELVETDLAGEQRDAVVAMYERFDPADRAQGIPPIERDAIERWLDELICEHCLNVVARDGDRVIGHAMAVPDETGTPETIDAYELAIFVESAYQNVGIGTELTSALLGDAAAADVEYVWLTVERWNDPAVAVYREVGFEVVESTSFELEMAIRLTA